MATVEGVTMKAAQVPSPGADFQIVEREIPKPDAGQVRIKVQACGVCHSDVLTKDGLWPGIQYPGCRDTKLQAWLMKWVRAFPRGRKDSVSVWAGTAAMTTRAGSAGEGIFAIAAIRKSAASATTADTSSTWWLRWKRWCQSRRR